MSSDDAQERALREEQERRDWFEMMQSEAAFRVWLGLIQEMGVGRLMVTEEGMRMRNIADQILARMAEAVPETYLRMLRALHGL